MMELLKVFVSFIILFAILIGHNVSGVRASSRLQERSQKVTNDAFQAEKLFVFGDSYADTGNSDFTDPSWNPPYGMTYPGHPTGRNSDGRLLTDYVAKFYGLKTPKPSRFIDPSDPKQLQYGANFAYGGTGVFDTGIGYANLTAQIDILKGYLKIHAVGLEKSLSLLSVNGNDYAAYLRHNHTIEELPQFIYSVIQQIKKDMESLHDLGAPKVAVTAMPPSGCIPFFAPSPTQCNVTLNIFVSIHNYFLNRTVMDMNKESGGSSYFVLNLYDAFETVFHSGKFTNPYQACIGGEPVKVCSDPKSAFYWDVVHPTQAGWRAVYDLYLKQALEQIN